MHSQCPHCQAVFRVTVRDLIAAKGMVRCGQCGGVFNAQQALVSAPPPEPLSDIDPVFEIETEAAALADKSKDKPYSGFSDKLPHWASPTWLQAALSPSRHAYRFDSRANVLLSLGIPVLVLALLGQYVWYAREDPARHPYLAALCEQLGCEAPISRDPDRIEVVERSVESHPTAPGALLITATLVNGASFAQPYPLMQVALTDLQGNVTALRRFEPEEYLAAATTLMAPGEPVDVSLEVADPGRNTVAFEFEFF